jgi:hypothetical protein
MPKLRTLRKNLISGTAIGILIGAIGLYYELWGSRTHMTVDIAAESNVLDVKHPLPELTILFQGKDLEQERSDLRILTLRVINDGTVNIHEDDFDSRLPFGVLVNGGQIVRAQVVGSNSDYLADNIHVQVISPNQVSLAKIIFDKGSFVTLQILVIEPKSSNLEIRPLGKIAGLSSISVSNSFQTGAQPGLLTQIFEGSTVVQILRALAYSILTLIAVVLIAILIAGITSIPGTFARFKRKRLATELRRIGSKYSYEKRAAVEKIYVQFGLAGLEQARETLANRNELLGRMMVLKEWPRRTETARDEEFLTTHVESDSYFVVGPLIKPGFIKLSAGELIVDPDIEAVVAEYIEQVKTVEL